MSRVPLAAIPTGHVPVPDAVASLAGDGHVTPVWRNELGGLTFRVEPAASDGSGPTRYVKWVPAGTPEIDLRAEAGRLAWAGEHVRVPRVLDVGGDPDATWLVTAAIEARSAVDPRWVADPATAAAAVGQGLRVLHDAAPADACPYTWSAEDRAARARAACRRRRRPRALVRRARTAGCRRGVCPDR
nr:phosphotransferase [Oerskovia sp. JB1-3-2]